MCPSSPACSPPAPLQPGPHTVPLSCRGERPEKLGTKTCGPCAGIWTAAAWRGGILPLGPCPPAPANSPRGKLRGTGGPAGSKCLDARSACSAPLLPLLFLAFLCFSGCFNQHGFKRAKTKSNIFKCLYFERYWSSAAFFATC